MTDDLMISALGNHTTVSIPPSSNVRDPRDINFILCVISRKNMINYAIAMRDNRNHAKIS